MQARLETAPAASSHLSAIQLEHLLQRLIDEQDAHLTRLKELETASDLEPDLVAVLQSRCQESLDEVQRGLALIYNGGYGLCSHCRTVIPFERLQAVPGARHCVKCQTGQDRAPR